MQKPFHSQTPWYTSSTGKNTCLNFALSDSVELDSVHSNLIIDGLGLREEVSQ